MVYAIDETRNISGPKSKRYNQILYWGREHRLLLKEQDESTITFIDRHWGEGGNTSLLWPKRIIITITGIDDKALVNIKMESINGIANEEQYIPGMRMFWIDILINFWRNLGVDPGDAYYREHYSQDTIKKRVRLRYNQIIFFTIMNSIFIFLSTYFLSYIGLFIGLLLCAFSFFGELLLNFQFINIVKVSKQLYPEFYPIEPRKLRLVTLIDNMITYDPF